MQQNFNQPQFIQNGPTKYCKKCHSVMPQVMKVCPTCGKKQSGKAKWIILGVVIFFVLVAAIGGGSGDKKPKVTDNKTGEAVKSTESTETTESGDGKTHVAPGQTFDDSGISVSINDFDDNYKVKDDEYGLYKPDKGKKHIKISLTFVNNNDSNEYIDIYCFKCYADDESFEQVYLDGDDFINTNLASGKKKSFDIFFDVPKKAKKIELEYAPTFAFSGKDIVVDLK